MPANLRTDTPRALLRSTVGMKAVMATTGAILVAYVVSHVAANLLVFHSPEAINGYGALLHRTGPLLWVARGVLLLAAVLHVTVAVRLTRQARRARPVPYAVYEAQAATLAALVALVALGFASIPLAVALGVLSAPPPAVAAAR